MHVEQLGKSLTLFLREQSAWSQSAFGPDSERGPIGPLKHLAKEAVEAQQNPTDIMEFVDCFFLTIDATRRAGFTFEQLLAAAWEKLAINKVRTWPQPSGPDEAIEHARDVTPGSSADSTHGSFGPDPYAPRR